MGTAPLALGEALVDAVPVGLVGDDENATVGPCGGSRKESHACQNCGDNSHRVPENKMEKMENVAGASHDEPGRFHGEMRRLWGVALTPHPRLFHGIGMNGLLAICGICREIMR